MRIAVTTPRQWSRSGGMATPATDKQGVTPTAEWDLHSGSCFDPGKGLAVLADQTVDIVISDPPYEAEAHTSHRIIARAGGKLEVEPLTFPAITEDERTES